MAAQAKSAHIRQIALAAAFGDRHDVIGIPHRFAAAFLQIPFFEEVAAGRVVELAHVTAQRGSVHAALGADALIALEHFFAQIARVGAKLPFVNAGVGAESSAAFAYFAAAPAAERTAVSPRSLSSGRRFDPAASLVARREDRGAHRGLVPPMPNDDSITSFFVTNQRRGGEAGLVAGCRSADRAGCTRVSRRTSTPGWVSQSGYWTKVRNF